MQKPLPRALTFDWNVYHIFRQDSIFNISGHHNPRQGIRGMLRKADLTVTWLGEKKDTEIESGKA